MNLALYQHNSHQYPQCSFIEVNNRLYRDSIGFKQLLQFILWIYFCFSVKAFIFVRKFYYLKVFALFFLWSDKRKPTAGYFILNRLLYFIRAVGYPTPTEAIRSEWESECSIVYAVADRSSTSRIGKIGKTMMIRTYGFLNLPITSSSLKL